MALITRVSRLFRADLHAVLDRIEEPDVLLRQAVREMEEALARDQQRVKRMIREHGQLCARQADLDRSLGDIEEQLDVCFESGKDDLARALIRRKLEAQRLRKTLATKREALEQTLAGLQTQLDANRARLESMRQKAELLAEEDAAVHPVDRWAAPEALVRDDEVEVAFLREQQKRRPS